MKVRISRADAIRAAITAACTIPLSVPLAARADLNQGALGATCVGFGCNDYRGQDFNGMPAPGGEDYVSENTLQVVRPAERGSMPYSEFLQALKDKRVLGVDFIAPNGDEVYAGRVPAPQHSPAAACAVSRAHRRTRSSRTRAAQRAAAPSTRMLPWWTASAGSGWARGGPWRRRR